MARVNFSAHGKALEDARRRVMNGDADAHWALFSTDKDSNLKVQEIGDGPLDDLEEHFDSGKIQYALARVQDPNSKLTKFVFISWCGDGVPTAMKGRFNSHVAVMSNFLKGHHVHINARNEDDVKASHIMAKVRDSSGAKYSVHNEVARKEEPIEPVGSVYKPQAIPNMNALSLQSQEQEDVPIRSVYEPVKIPEPRRLSKDRITPRGSQEELETSVFVKRPSVSSIRGIPINVPGLGASESTGETPAQRRAQQEREEREREEEAHREREKRNARMTEEEELRKRDEQEKERADQAALQRQRQALQQQRQEQQRQQEEEERQRKEEKEKEEERSRAATEKQGNIVGSVAHTIAGTASAAGSAISHALADTASAATNLISHVVHSKSNGTTAVVLYPYEAAESNEMSLVEGETITNIEQIDECWWQGIGQSGAKSGLFPSNYVQINSNEENVDNTMPEKILADDTVQVSDKQFVPGASALTAEALYDYTAGEENEISFREGDTIINVEMVSEDWWQGEVAGKTGIGLFPANYVKLNEQ